MVLNDLITQISDIFKNDIYSSKILNLNEIYVNVNPNNILKICEFLHLRLQFPLVCMFANDERAISNDGNFAIYYVFADRENSNLIILKTAIDHKKMAFVSICAKIQAAVLYEREIHDLFGLVPTGHPDLKRLVFHGNWPDENYPLRKDFDIMCKPELAEKEIPFTRIDGVGVYEIPVGPVHAGIIEPGHFRFSVAGEPIINLEAQLYFVHKGIEKIAEGASIEKTLFIAERISGDETFTNSLAYCEAIEKIADVNVPDRAKYSRILFAELERLTSHLGDLAGICIDVAYGFAAFQFRMMRGWAYLIADELCGMRFLRGVNKPGGIRKDFVSGKEKSIIESLIKIKIELLETAKIIKQNTLFIDRLENTGVLSHDIAVDFNVVGPGGRASGINNDVRKSFPYEAYGKLEFSIPHYTNGDVDSRMNTKLVESIESINLMISALESMPQGKVVEHLNEVEPYKFAFGITEAPRGENIHWIMTGEKNTIFRYKIRTPSFCNWPALCLAVRNNIVPDFPLINKSFNLSYAGNDL